MACDMTPGDRSENVTRLQQFLRVVNLYYGSIDGYYGPITSKAVNQYQRRHGLKVDGQAGCITTRYMDLSCAHHNCDAPKPAPLAPAPVPVAASVVASVGSNFEDSDNSIDLTPPIGAYSHITFQLMGKTHPSIPIVSVDYQKDLFDPVGSGELETPYTPEMYNLLTQYGEFELSWNWEQENSNNNNLIKVMNGVITQIHLNKNHIIANFVDKGQKLKKKTIENLPIMSRSDAVIKVVRDAGLNPVLNWGGDGKITYSSLRPHWKRPKKPRGRRGSGK